MAFDNFFTTLSQTAVNSDYRGIFATSASTVSLSANLSSLSAEGADIVICDSIFIGRTEPDRLVSNDGIHFCERAGAKKLVIFPHPPECDDDFLDGVARYSSAFRPTTMIASEGMVLHP